MGLYDYNNVFTTFDDILQQNCERANAKKKQYLDKIIMIFTQFVKKCEKEIDNIIEMKINKLSRNYQRVKEYFMDSQKQLRKQDKNLIIAEFLIRPFEKFPFSGNKNQKLFKEQYNLIQKASVLIQQTLIQSFNEEQVPSFENTSFFQTINNHGIGKQSITKLRINPQNFNILPLHQIIPIQNRIKSIMKLNEDCILCFGYERYIELWDILDNFCIQKIYIDQPSQIVSACFFNNKNENSFFVIGTGDQSPTIIAYRTDNWQPFAQNITHTRQITKLLQHKDILISGSSDGNVCLHYFGPIKTFGQYPHISGIEDIIIKNNFLYLLQKNSAICQYQIIQLTNGTRGLNFRRSLSAGFISMIRYPQLTSNFSGIGCHIYGLSQIEITRKFKVDETNIINIPQMISDFIVLQSKQTSQFFALCVFQNSATIRIYSLISQEQVYEFQSDYSGEVGASTYLPKIQITYINNKYMLSVISESEFEDQSNKIKIYELLI